MDPTAKTTAHVDAPPVPVRPDRAPVRIPAPRRPLDDANWLLPHRPEAARQARREVRRVLGEWGLGTEGAETVVLVVCELVTNAVEHAEAPLRLHLHRDLDQGVWVGVSDGGPAQHEGPWTASCTGDEHGRGLHIVEALTSAHGTQTHAAGSTHWARLHAA